MSAAPGAGLAEGLRLFDAGEHWHAHEAWEDAWRADRAGDRDYFKGLIQLAAVCYHLRRGNRRPVARLLARACHHLTVHDGPRWPFEHATLMAFTDTLAASAPDAPLPRLADCVRTT